MKVWLCFGMVLYGLAGLGCGTLQMKPEGRSGMDQLMAALSLQNALNELDIQYVIGGKAVSYTVTGHSDEIEYVNEIIPAYLSKWDAFLDQENAEIHLTFVIDAAGADTAKGGLALPIPLPSITTGITLTQIDIGTITEQWSTSRMWVYAANLDGQVVYSSDPAYDSLWIKNFNLFGLSIGRVKNFDADQITVTDQDENSL